MHFDLHNHGHTTNCTCTRAGSTSLTATIQLEGIPLNQQCTRPFSPTPSTCSSTLVFQVIFFLLLFFWFGGSNTHTHVRAPERLAEEFCLLFIFWRGGGFLSGERRGRRGARAHVNCHRLCHNSFWNLCWASSPPQVCRFSSGEMSVFPLHGKPAPGRLFSFRTHIHKHMHTRTCTYAHAHKHIHAHTHMHKHIHAHTHMHARTCTHTYTRTRTHAHAHTHTHTYTHMQHLLLTLLLILPSFSWSAFCSSSPSNQRCSVTGLKFTALWRERAAPPVKWPVAPVC